MKAISSKWFKKVSQKLLILTRIQLLLMPHKPSNNFPSWNLSHMLRLAMIGTSNPLSNQLSRSAQVWINWKRLSQRNWKKPWWMSRNFLLLTHKVCKFYYLKKMLQLLSLIIIIVNHKAINKITLEMTSTYIGSLTGLRIGRQ